MPIDPQPVFLVAQQGPPEEAIAAIVGAVMIFGLLFAVVLIGLTIWAAFILYRAMERLPAAHRQAPSWLPWLMPVPMANIVMPIIIGIKWPESFQGYFNATGRAADPAIGDAGKQLGLTWGICALCTLVPLLGLLALPVVIITAIMFIVRMNRLSRLIPAATTEAYAPPAPASVESAPVG